MIRKKFKDYKCILFVELSKNKSKLMHNCLNKSYYFEKQIKLI